jgi:tetratricopeptide (TPR) repeat protein
LGSVVEGELLVMEPPDSTRDVPGSNRDRRALLATAEAAYRRALEIDPDLAPARLRRGRVLAQSGRPDAAASELEWVVTHSKDRELVYLAHLFHGRIHEDAGRLVEAAESYRLAVAQDPPSQAANLALGHVLDALGERAVAAEAWSKAAAGNDRKSDDAWWNYPFGEAHRTDALFDGLRAEASR